VLEYEVRAPRRKLLALARACDDEADGRQMRGEVAANLHAALEPAVAEVRGAILGMSSGGLPHDGEPLRAAVASAVRSDIRLSGKFAGARIQVTKRGMPRGFANAPKRLNARRGWRHRVFGRDVWVTQIGEPGWFDDTMARGHRRYRAAVEKAMDGMANRIVRKG
jgi:hypothetical protein